MSKETTRISLRADPAIENLKSKIENRKDWSRRKFLSAAALAGTGALWGLRSELAAAEPPPETTKLRLIRVPTVCYAPQYVAEELLRSEGFTDVQYIKVPPGIGVGKALASGEADLSMWFAASVITRLDAGDPTVFLAGVHIGCFELFGTNRVRSIRDLKGKTVAISSKEGPQQVFLSSMMAHVGLDPKKDINWVVHPFEETMQLLAEGKVDAFLGFPPQPQQVRANGLLDLAKIDAGKMDVIAETFRLEDIINMTTATVEPLLKDGRVRIVRDIPAGLPPLRTDRDKLKQILFNLLSNAAKFTEEGEIRISAHQNDGTLNLAVSDTGIGMKKEALEHIFEEFQQAEKTTASKYGGTGLGLAIVKKFVNLMGGEIVAESEQGKGSKFTITIPMELKQ